MDSVKSSKSDLTEDQFISKLRGWEGAIDHFYCDGRGLVTCGIGSLIDPLPSIGKNKFNKLEFFEADKNFAATSGNCFTYASNPQKIIDSFNAVKRSRAGAHSASKLTTLRITERSFLNLFLKSDYAEAKRNANTFYSNLPSDAKINSFNALPQNIQWALIDMSFNLGLKKLSKYQKLKLLLARGNFYEAANESFRHGGLQPSRNQTIYKWIYMYSDQAFADSFENRYRA